MSKEVIAIDPGEAERRRIQRERNQPLIVMVDEWLASDSDEDAEAFERLKVVLEAAHTPPRKLFHDE